LVVWGLLKVVLGSRFEDLLKRLSDIFAFLNVFIENEKEKNLKNEKGKKN
jgi:hypothetical protein